MFNTAAICKGNEWCVSAITNNDARELNFTTQEKLFG